MSPPKKPASAVAKLGQYRRHEMDSQSQDAPHGEETFVGAETAKVLEAITTCQEAVTACIEEVNVDISLLRQDFQNLRERVSEAETRLSTVEDSPPPLQNTTADLQLQMSQLLQKQDDIENRLRRCNIRFICLPEGAEGRDSPRFWRS